MGFKVKQDTTQGLRDAHKNVPKMSRNVSLKLAWQAVNLIKNNINANRITPAKKQSTIQKSKSKSAVTLVDTRKYVNGLRAVPTSEGAALTGNLTLARLLEGGTKNMQARPHIRPAIRRLNVQAATDTLLEDLFGG